MQKSDITEVVREKYAQAALRAGGSCCGSAAMANVSPITSNLYDQTQMETLPEAALLASLGCGNPTALAELKPGEHVLDLGSGGGIDVLLSARRVGPAGKAYGLDMTDEMLALARENQRKVAADNVEFLKGQIENIPLPDNSVDVIISNCVINLSADKDRVLQEAFRVLRPKTCARTRCSGSAVLPGRLMKATIAPNSLLRASIKSELSRPVCTTSRMRANF